MKNNETNMSPFEAMPNQTHAEALAIAFVTAHVWDDVYASLRSLSRQLDSRSLSDYLGGCFFERYTTQPDADALQQLQVLADKYLGQEGL